MSDRHQPRTTASIRSQFIQFAEREAREASFYSELSRCVAEDEEILGLGIDARVGQKVPNLLFGAVQYILMCGVDHPLRQIYPTLGGSLCCGKDAFQKFRDICLSHRHDILALIRSRTVQSHEVRRCALLLPALTQSFKLHPCESYHFIDVGASAGLNLLWSDYLYEYDGVELCGTSESGVRIQCATRGAYRIPLSRSLPQQSSRIGIDLEPVDLGNEAHVRWLRALVWPEFPERLRLLNTAISYGRRMPVSICKGDARYELPRLLRGLCDKKPVCIVASFAVNQIFPNGRSEFTRMLLQHSQERTIHEITIGYFGELYPELWLGEYCGGRMREARVALCDLHGRWIEWLLGQPCI